MTQQYDATVKQRVKKFLTGTGALTTSMKQIRRFVKANRKELFFIKLSGKGRTKQKIFFELRYWLSRAEVNGPLFSSRGHRFAKFDRKGHYDMNSIPIGVMHQLCHPKNVVFAERLVKERDENGTFDCWTDAERRVEGLKRSMFSYKNECQLDFDEPEEYSDDFLMMRGNGTSYKDDAFIKEVSLDLMGALQANDISDMEVELQESKVLESKVDDQRDVSFGLESPVLEDLCIISPEDITSLMEDDPRIVNPTPLNISVLLLFVVEEMPQRMMTRNAHATSKPDQKFMHYCTGTLIDEQHVITCAHGMDKYDANRKHQKHFQWGCGKIIVFSHKGDVLGQIQTIYLPCKITNFPLQKGDDYALLKMESKIKADKRHLFQYPLFETARTRWKNLNFSLCGYPGKVANNKTHQVKLAAGGRRLIASPTQYMSSGTILQVKIQNDGNLLRRFAGCAIQTLATPGNSGGGLFSQTQNGQVTLTGILSNLGGKKSRDCVVGVAMSNHVAAFITECVGHDLNYTNDNDRHNVKKYMQAAHDQKCKLVQEELDAKQWFKKDETEMEIDS